MKVDGQMDAPMDGQTAWERQSGVSEEPCWPGLREHLPAGLRRSHGVCDSGPPPSPADGQEGPPGRQRVDRAANVSTFNRLKLFQECFRRVESPADCWC